MIDKSFIKKDLKDGLLIRYQLIKKLANILLMEVLAKAKTISLRVNMKRVL